VTAPKERGVGAAADLSKATFGPVIECTVSGEGDAHQRFIDFDTGKLFAAAEFFGTKAEPSPEETQKWWRKTGIDAVGDTSAAVRGLIGFDMVATPVPSEEWERATPARLDYYFALAKPGTPATISGRGELPATFAFKTREGGQGLLQLTGFSENPRGVKIRYKLVQVGRVDSKSAKTRGADEQSVAQSALGDNKYKLSLTNGVSFEVVAVTRNPMMNKPWWKPDGTPLPQPPGWSVRSGGAWYGRSIPESDCGILVRCDLPAGQPANWQHSKQYTPAGQFLGKLNIEQSDRATQPAAAAGKFVAKADDSVEVLAFPAGVEEVTLLFRAASIGLWEPVAIFDGKRTERGKFLLSGDYGTRTKVLLGGVHVLFNNYRQGGLGECLDVTHDLDREFYALRVIAVYQDGTRQEIRYESSRPQEVKVIGQLLRWNNIKEFVLERTPWVRAEIRNIALKPKTQ